MTPPSNHSFRSKIQSRPGCHRRPGGFHALLVILCMCVAGCSDRSNRGDAATPGSGTRTFEVRGFVRELPDLAEHTIMIEHEDIPGFMPAMTMPFDFRDPNAVAGLSVGDAIVFHLAVTNDASWISDVRRSGAPDTPANPPVPLPAGEAIERVAEGGILPEFELVDQGRRPIRRDSFAGKPLVLTFIFTRCPIPNYCPRMSQNFQALQQAVRADATLAGQVNLLSISFDEDDTPERLAEYGSAFSQDMDSWRFATGRPEQVRKLTRAFAVLVERDGGTISHGLATVLVGPDGVVRNIWRGNSWRTEEVLESLRVLRAHVARAEDVASNSPEP